MRREKVKIFRVAEGGKGKCKSMEKQRENYQIAEAKNFTDRILNRPCIIL